MKLTVAQSLGEADAAADDLNDWSDTALLGEFLKRRRHNLKTQRIASMIDEQKLLDFLDDVLSGREQMLVWP